MKDHDSDTHAVPSACNEFRERISIQIESPDSESIAWRRHALACKACAIFETNLRSVHTDLGLVRGTPVRDLWPAIAVKIVPTPARTAPVRTIGMRVAVAAAGALAVWSTLAFISRRSGGQAQGQDSLERALATLSVVSTIPDELVHTDSVPEVRLLARISGSNGEQR